MKYIFFDETGDLSFDLTKKQVSKYFTVVFLIIDDFKQIERSVRKAVSSLQKHDRVKSSGYLHAYKEKPLTIARLLRYVAKRDIQIAYLTLDKSRMKENIGNMNKRDLYNKLTVDLLNEIYQKKIIEEDTFIKFIASKRETKESFNDQFIEYIQRNFKAKINVLIQSPHESRTLQAVDFIAWAIYCKNEHGNTEYFDIICEKIVDC
jgi:hypothetical protein